PPAWAMAMAMALSVTVSMAEEMIGRLREMSRVTRVEMSASVGSTSERAGCSSTSSKVSAESPVIDETILAKGAPSSEASEMQEARGAATHGQAPGWRG